MPEQNVKIVMLHGIVFEIQRRAARSHSITKMKVWMLGGMIFYIQRRAARQDLIARAIMTKRLCTLTAATRCGIEAGDR